MNAQPHELLDAAVSFAELYHASDALLRDNRGWSLTIALLATDSQDAVWLRVDDGHLVEVKPIPSDTPAVIVVRAECAVLRDILRLERLPNEPYLFGELVVEGPEPDFLRLDYILTSLAGAA